MITILINRGNLIRVRTRGNRIHPKLMEKEVENPTRNYRKKKKREQLFYEAKKEPTFVASCFLGAFPPVDLRAVCLVRAISSRSGKKKG